MLISRVQEAEELANEPLAPEGQRSDDSHEYQTASELFDIMAKTHNFQGHETDSLSTRDLILLYKNIDLGTKLMSSANELKRKAPNQYVETIIYHEDSDSDLSEICSSEDLHNVILINQERLDLFENCSTSFDSTLCHKIGDFEIHSTNLSKEYDKGLFFNPGMWLASLKQKQCHWQSLDLMSTSIGADHRTILPCSLLDYICYNGLEDVGYNSYMDSVIRYVKNTIDHLKRISDGEYLTEKAKQKWQEKDPSISDKNKSIVIANSISIPLHVERKIGIQNRKLDALTRSELDLKSFNKILEKKIVIELPTAICNSFALFKSCKENLVLTCKKEEPTMYEDNHDRPAIDVIVQLTPSKTEAGISTISSITFVQKTFKDERPDVLPLTFEEHNKDNVEPCGSKVVIHEIDQNSNSDEISAKQDFNATEENNEENYDELTVDDTLAMSSDSADQFSCYRDSSDSSRTRNFHKRHRFFKAGLAAAPDELKITIQRLSAQCSLPEESLDESTYHFNRKKSPTHRLKSPYENKSFAIETQKRKRLLEIRQRREKRKMAVAETCKAGKNKYSKGIVMTQPSSSVAKLSITNKSFYNSIYGHIPNSKQSSSKNRKLRKVFGVEDWSDAENMNEDDIPSSEANSQKYINKNYFLDDAVTEMMYMEMKQKSDGQDLCSDSTISNDLTTKLNILNQLITPLVTDLSVSSKAGISQSEDELRTEEPVEIVETDKEQIFESIASSQNDYTDSSKSPKTHRNQYGTSENLKQIKEKSSIEFRKSIDKIYDLMHKLGKGSDNKMKSKFTTVLADRDIKKADQTNQPVDKTTNQRLEKDHNDDIKKAIHQQISKFRKPKSPQSPSVIVPKVVISNKTQAPKVEGDRVKRDRKKNTPFGSVSESPLKAISQLLHEFDNVQKTRHKTVAIDTKSKRYEIVANEGKSVARQGSAKRSREQPDNNRSQMMRQRAKSSLGVEPKTPMSHQIQADREIKKQVADLVDEFKEARGEAVRGPARPSSRLDSLAQPKRSYIQAQIEDFQSRYGNNSIMSDRLVRIAGSVQPQPKKAYIQAQIEEGQSRCGRRATSPRNIQMPASGPPPAPDIRNRFRRADPMGVSRHSPSTPPPTERTHKPRASCSNRETKMTPLNNNQSLKQLNVTDTFRNKKMVAVESYLKNHYGRPPQLANHNELLRTEKTRVPLLPTEFELSSKVTAENGYKHQTAETSISYTLPLAVLPECNENMSENSKENWDESACNLDNEKNSTDASSLISIPSCSHKPMKAEPKTFKPQKKITKTFSCASINPMQNLIIIRSKDKCISKSKALVPTSKHDLLSDSKHNLIQNMKSLSPFTKIGFEFPEFRMPVATVGYCFPRYQNAVPIKSSLILSSHALSIANTDSDIDSYCPDTNDATNQCIMGKAEPVTENAVQTENKSIADIPKINYGEPLESRSPKSVNKCKNFVTLEETSDKMHIISDLKESNLSIYENKINNSNSSESNLLKCETKGEKLDVPEVNPLISEETSPRDSNPAEPNQSRCEQTCSNYKPPESNLLKYEKILDNFMPSESNLSNCDKNSNQCQFKYDPELRPDTKTLTCVESKQIPASGTTQKDKDDLVEVNAKLSISDLRHSSKGEIIDYSSSLDILVGLLNEIQNITTCQTQITRSSSNASNNLIDDLGNVFVESLAPGYLPMKKTPLTNLLIENKEGYEKKQISINVLEEIRKIESNTSIRSLYKNNGVDRFTLNVKQPMCIDKQINVEMHVSGKELTNSCTEVPSQFFPIYVNTGTNVSNSRFVIPSQQSNSSICSCDANRLHSKSNPPELACDDKCLSSNASTNDSNARVGTASQQADRFICSLDENRSHPNNNTPELTCNDRRVKRSTARINRNNEIVLLKRTDRASNQAEIKTVIPKISALKKPEAIICNKTLIPHTNYVGKSDFDPMLRVKRDVLVTMYSVLVFTVFAALSLPGMLYRP